MGDAMKKTKEELSLTKAIGRVIAKRRTERSMTQEYVAERLGVGYEAVSRIERGAIMPTIGKLIQLAGVFNCPIEELLVESSNRATDQGAVLSKMIDGLSETDRTFMLEIIEKMVNKLKEKTPVIPKRSKKV
jgi:transcriptional regulator with XRE-family HTH domain